MPSATRPRGSTPPASASKSRPNWARARASAHPPAPTPPSPRVASPSESSPSKRARSPLSKTWSPANNAPSSEATSDERFAAHSGVVVQIRTQRRDGDVAAAAVEQLRGTVEALEREIGRIIVGQEIVVRGVTIALLAGGHVLLEGLPGLGKTLLVRTIARALQLQYSRVQFTPDLMPADILGTNVLLEAAHGGRAFQFQPGPIFANLILADEINRATPKTQSALLEAMQEQAVTVGTIGHPLPRPFFVL